MATSANEGFDIRRARTPPGPSGNQHSGAIVAECSAHDISLCLLVSLPFIEPCRPKPVKRLPTGEKWSHEPKLDGWRCEAVRRGKEVALYSRLGRTLNPRFQTIAEAVGRLPCRSVTLDGELVFADDSGINFYRLRGARPSGSGSHRNRPEAGHQRSRCGSCQVTKFLKPEPNCCERRSAPMPPRR